jgi:hypothetical protein
MRDDVPRVKVVGVPRGEAPLWVREKWVGLELPLARPVTRPRTYLTSGVLSGPRTVWLSLLRLVLGRARRAEGFPVETVAAIAILERTAPDAAAWWRTNTPHLLKPRRYFVFDASACQRVVGS